MSEQSSIPQHEQIESAPPGPLAEPPSGSGSTSRDRGSQEVSPISAPIGLTGIAVLLGLAVEVLFFGHQVGISFPIWAILSVLGLLGASKLEGVRPAGNSSWLVTLILLFASVAAIRVEPMTVSLSVLATLILLGLWLRTFRSGDLFKFGWTDLLIPMVVIPLEAWIRPWGTLGAAQRHALRGRRARALGLLRGIILAMPILFIFAALLAAADLIFADWVERALSWLDLERVVEYMGRGTILLAGGLFSLGAIAIALRKREKRAGEGKALVKPFLGLTEALVVLTSVDLIFLIFVVIQVTYLFGGENNITLSGYTYSEYARRGFGELVAVSILSLGLIYSLGAVTVRETKRQTVPFNALSVLLVFQVGVILSSALTRLLLYENAYGFTRLRTYTHVAIHWMAVLFILFLIALLRGRLKRFALATAAVALGYAATLALLNVDGFIVARNAARMDQTGNIDLPYLLSLSEDAVPGLVRLVERQPGLAAELMPQLACWRGQLATRERYWASFQLSRTRADRVLSSLSLETAEAPVWRTAWGQWKISLGGDDALCLHQPWMGGPD